MVICKVWMKAGHISTALLSNDCGHNNRNVFAGRRPGGRNKPTDVNATTVFTEGGVERHKTKVGGRASGQTTAQLSTSLKAVITHHPILSTNDGGPTMIMGQQERTSSITDPLLPNLRSGLGAKGNS